MINPADQTRNSRIAAHTCDEYRDPYPRPDQSVTHPVGISASGRSFVIQVQAVRQLRRTICLAVLAFTIGSLVIVLNSPSRHGFLAPGALANSHAQILGGLNPDRCQACHESGGKSVSQWLAGTLGSGHVAGQPKCQSDLCLKCHQDSLESKHPMNPHGMGPDQLAIFTRRALSRTSDGKTIQVSSIQSAKPVEVACSVCHREHHGEQFNLTALTDHQCQVCHTSTFHRFDLDHPNFAVAANSRNANLNFDHFSHGTLHFAGASRTFDCKSCHPADNSGRNRVTAGFEAACASCHGPALIDSQFRGIELILLPVLDVDAIHAAGLELVNWPANAIGDFDGRLPPMQRLLLAADPELQQLMNDLPDEFQFSDIDPHRTGDLRLAASLAAGYQRLFREVTVSGKSAIIGRMMRVAQMDLTGANSTFANVLADLDDASLRQAIQAWMPETVAGTFSEETGGPKQAENGSAKHDDSPSPQSRLPVGELLAKNPVGSLLHPDVASSKFAQSEPAEFQANDPQAVRTEGVLQQARPDLRSSFGDRRSDPLLQAANDMPAANMAGELLSANPLNFNEFRSPADAQQAQVISKIVSETEPSGHLAESRSLGNATPKQAVNLPDQLPADGSFFSTSTPLAQANTPEWKLDDALMVISWQPSGHGDVFTQSILEWIASAKTTAVPTSGMRHFADSFESAGGPGQCAQCHRLNKSGSAENRLAWQSRSHAHLPKSFTRFDHGPHTLVANCETCHTLADMDRQQQGTSPFQMASWKQMVESAVVSPVPDCGLNPVTAKNCSSCHRPNAAPNGCTTCHNYHVSNRLHVSAAGNPVDEPNR